MSSQRARTAPHHLALGTALALCTQHGPHTQHGPLHPARSLGAQTGFVEWIEAGMYEESTSLASVKCLSLGLCDTLSSGLPWFPSCPFPVCSKHTSISIYLCLQYSCSILCHLLLSFSPWMINSKPTTQIQVSSQSLI